MSTRIERAVPARAGRREWIGLAVLALPCLLYSMDLTVLNLAVPHLSADLQPSAVQLLWIVDIYGFLVAGALITMGTLGDRIGRRRLLMFGATAFGLASVLAAFSTTAEMLMIARAVLGLAGATLAPSTLSLIRNMFLDARQRTVAIGVWVACFSAGATLGPLIGGVLLHYFWWGSVFLLAVPGMVLLLLIGPALLPEFRDPNAGRLDLISAAQSLVAVLSLIYGVKHIAEQGVSGQAALVMLAGLIVGVSFVRRQQRLADPFIDVRLLRTPAFGASLSINLVVSFTALGFFFLIVQYFQMVLGMGPLEAGLWTAPSGLAFVIGAITAPLLARRFKVAHVLAAGFTLAALGLTVLTQIDAAESFGMLMAGYLLFCLGLAPVGPLTTDLVVGAAPPERAGAASAISETGFELGGALGIAVLGSIATAVYQGIMASSVPPGIPDGAAQLSSETLGNAVAIAGLLPQQAGTELLAAAREAFTRAMEQTAAVGIVFTIAAAAMAMIALRAVNAGPSSGEPADTREPASAG
jgi:MFS transporter, DHA2 family, multidrug resistance protein